MLTYDVKVWSIRERTRAKGKKTFEVRWLTAGEGHGDTFSFKPQAEGRRLDLMTAIRNGERFDTETGLPESELKAQQAVTWLTHAREYVAMKWPTAAAKQRANIAETLANTTPALTREGRNRPDPKLIRKTLLLFAFRMARDAEGKWAPRTEVDFIPDDVARCLKWLHENSVDIASLDDDPALTRAALDSMTVLLDGSRAADNTIRRKVPVFTNCLRYAIERKRLSTLPTKYIDWQAPESDQEVDLRRVPDAELADQLINAAPEASPTRGEYLKSFYATIYYSMARPGEAKGIRPTDCFLPLTGWGHVTVSTSTPDVGSGWTNDGTPYDSRGLKKRARNATREIPIPPTLVQILREHISQFSIGPLEYLWRSIRGKGPLTTNEYGEVWRLIRITVLTAEQLDEKLADRPYSLRAAGICLLLAAGLDPMEVARRAGHSVAVLFKFYARVIARSRQEDNARVDRLLEAAQQPHAVTEPDAE
ncbi:tyrosine-type recombinase/integrase [Streptomyces sp. BI20]|uniref:tyrosine-type recombinase/integrase n=1 Tax=Streptomyces sp. BI20 TaxID=3403460 RepID=UPI003C75426E